jgi:glycosylphosphatidylinositol transamidase (GPIT) subunit GPI8
MLTCKLRAKLTKRARQSSKSINSGIFIYHIGHYADAGVDFTDAQLFDHQNAVCSSVEVILDGMAESLTFTFVHA